MTKKALIGIALVLSFSLTAAAWDVLGSAYIMEKIRGGAGNAPGNELYGSTAPDFVNYMIGTPFYSFCYDETHTDFMRVWHMSNNGVKATDLQKVALGFVSHNGLWGSDYVAHVDDLNGTGKGYVINQAIYLEQVFAATIVDAAGHNVWDLLGVPAGMMDLRLELCHNIVEYIIDVQIWVQDPTLAGRIVAAATARNAGFPGLAAQAYAKLLADFSQGTDAPMSVPAATAWIQGYELAFQQREVLYASLFASASDFTGVLKNLSGYLSVLANTVFGLQTSPDQVESLLGLSFQALPNAIGELNMTADYVKGQLALHNVVYGPKSLQNRVDAGLARASAKR